MAMLGDRRDLSLVERKKRQWAAERAEMENLCTPWGLPPPAYGFGHHQPRDRYSSSLEIRETCPASTQQNLLPRRQRSPSLPPISNGARDHADAPKGKETRYDDIEGETSGYASDTIPQSSPDYWKKKESRQESRVSGPISAWNHSTTRSHDDEQRARWGDRGVATGRFWEATDPDARLPQVTTKGTPRWVERSLNMIDNGDTQILVIDQHSNHSSGGDNSEYRAMSENHEKNTYLLGQNAPLEPNIKAEREYRRQKALELQAAIVQQLEDREKQKRDERERRIKEEREEEERFRRQQELERQRLLEERRMAEEKQKREQKRAEALRVALERAEQQAKLEKENKKNRKLRENFDAMSLQSDQEVHYALDRSSKTNAPHHGSMIGETIQSVYAAQAFSPRYNQLQDQKTLPNFHGSSETNIVMSNPQSSRFSEAGDFHVNDVKPKKIETPRQNPQEPLNAIMHNTQSFGMMAEAPMSLVQIPLPQEAFNPMAAMSFPGGSGVQMAFLVPQTNLYPCMHQPISMHALFSMENQHKADETSLQKDRNTKVLTPSKYRNPDHKDASTQTEEIPNVLKINQEKSKSVGKLSENEQEVNLERNPSDEKLNYLKKEKRVTSEERIPVKDLESRPKWGVNKPPTQYKKQSEKDIFYTQKRKLRQRKRIQDKNYTSHSSDDNRSPSPSKNSGEKTRVSLSDYHWRKRGAKPDGYRENVTVETTQILPLECDPSGIVHIGENFHNQKRVYAEKKTLKRGVTLTEKFMNDKYGNPKLWRDENKTKYEHDIGVKEKPDNKKKYSDSLSGAKKEQIDYYEEPNQPLILDQLRSLRDSLKKQQQIWGKYDRSKSECDLDVE